MLWKDSLVSLLLWGPCFVVSASFAIPISGIKTQVNQIG